MIVSRYAESGIRGQYVDWWIRVKRKNPTLKVSISIHLHTPDYNINPQSSNNLTNLNVVLERYIIEQNSKKTTTTIVSRLTIIHSFTICLPKARMISRPLRLKGSRSERKRRLKNMQSSVSA